MKKITIYISNSSIWCVLSYRRFIEWNDRDDDDEEAEVSEYYIRETSKSKSMKKM